MIAPDTVEAVLLLSIWMLLAAGCLCVASATLGKIRFDGLRQAIDGFGAAALLLACGALCLAGGLSLLCR